MTESVKIRITGLVQGVGFRPFVYNLAVRLGVRGYCLNGSDGVIIEAEGDSIGDFIARLKTEAPPLSRIENITTEKTSGGAFSSFAIRDSVSETGRSGMISPDVSVCDDCLKELNDPSNRRHRYPFINCTNCGPRYSIIKDIPYDRQRTTMASFIMCADCETEYRDPSNRRFHAEPNACARCGPRAWLTASLGAPVSNEAINYDAIKLARSLLSEGAIIAVKGIGGFHLACNAGDDDAVKRLRGLKRRPSAGGSSEAGNKPFALMSASIGEISAFANVSADEGRALKDRARPIVLLEKIPSSAVSRHAAPGNSRYGVMLPYAPAHLLLLETNMTLVMTSGNASDEPIVTSNAEAIKRLSPMADYLLLHDRDIHMRVDDSIIMQGAAGRQMIRRARGFTPMPIAAADEMPDMLACGAELKNTFCITKGRNIILSQHIGDLENYEAVCFFEESLVNLKNSFKAAPVIIAHDLHPDYLSTRFAFDYAAKNNIPDDDVIGVQHHHAHVASVMAEHAIYENVIGAAMDGTGCGTDGNVWGGEFLIANRRSFDRAGHIDYFRLPGGERAVREPWRTAVSCLALSYGGEADKVIEKLFERIAKKDRAMILQMTAKGINSPLTSSVGRLFDAVSSILGIRDVITFEGEAAIELESAAGASAAAFKSDLPYSFAIIEDEPFRIDIRPLIIDIVSDHLNGVDAGVISNRFHATLAQIILTSAKKIRDATNIGTVALSGGVFQNKTLLDMTTEKLTGALFTVATNRLVPANDGGVSLGQATIAAAIIRNRRG